MKGARQMKLWISRKPRKDGKYKVTNGFKNGTRIVKILTKEKTQNSVRTLSFYLKCATT